MKTDEAEDICVEETLQLTAGFQDESTNSPAIDLQRIGDGTNEHLAKTGPDEDRDAIIDEYTEISYRVFNHFIRQNVPLDVASKYQTLDDIDEILDESAQKDVNRLYQKLKDEDNPLQVIKKRRPSVYDEYRQEKEKKIAEHLTDIEQLTCAWSQNPRLVSDIQKRQFLQDIGAISKTIGVQNAVEHLLPCLVECYNSDEAIHPDIYESHAVLLFNNLPGVIEYLVRDTKRKITLENEGSPKDDSFDRRFLELQDQNTIESTANAESGDVSDCQSDYSE